MEPNMTPNRDFWAGGRNRISASLVRLLTVIALIGVGVCPARAQDMGSQPAPPTSAEPTQPLVAPPTQPMGGLSDLEVLVTPYGWATWAAVGINPSNPRIPSSSGNIPFANLADHMTWVPFMGSAEVRTGPFGFVVDYIHAPLRAGITTRNIVFGGGTGGLVIDTGSGMLLYRAIAQPDQYVDVGVGFRVWGLDGDISLNEGLLPSLDVTRGTSWVDPLIGARYHRDLGNGFGATAYGAIGGFGVGAHIDWEVLGTIDYASNSWIDLHAGVRSLNFNYSFPRAGNTLHLYGPIIAATFRF
jgi:hypothetical protein